MKNFEELVESKKRAIIKVIGYYTSPNVDPEKIEGLKDMYFYISLTKTIAHYSAGHSKEKVRESLLEAITAMEIGFRWQGFAHSYAMYDQMVWMLSLAILCDLDVADYTRIADIIKRDGANDRLLSKLVSYHLPGYLGGYGENYIQRHPYADLDMLITGVSPTATFIKQYLDKKWYQGHRHAPWYDSHKRTKVNTYFGYWAWEAGALAKIMGIDDSTLTDQQYYPFRAVHWNDGAVV